MPGLRQLQFFLQIMILLIHPLIHLFSHLRPLITLPLILWYVLIRNRARLYLIITHSEILHSKPEPE